MLHHAHTHEPGPQTHGSVIHWAGLYDPLVNLLTLGRAPALREMTARRAQIQPGERVLDVGCGTGELTRVAQSRAGASGQVHGIDPSPEMIAVARQKAARAGAQIDFRTGVIEALPFPDGAFDVVLSSLMMHHLPDDLKRQGLAEIYRVLKPGGRLLVVDLKRPTSHGGRAWLALLMHHRLQQGVQELLPLMQAAGFTRMTAEDSDFSILGFALAYK